MCVCVCLRERERERERESMRKHMCVHMHRFIHAYVCVFA